jgi:hypothetical protein
MDPNVVRDFLPILEASFAYPELISRESDKHPRIRRLLLEFLRQNIHDSQLQERIQKVQEFVQTKTEP